jgi:hypothetical protein
VTGIIGRVGVLFFQPGQLSFQLAYPLVKTVQLGGQELVRPAGVAEESLRHDGSLPASPRVLRLHGSRRGCKPGALPVAVG